MPRLLQLRPTADARTRILTLTRQCARACPQDGRAHKSAAKKGDGGDESEDGREQKEPQHIRLSPRQVGCELSQTTTTRLGIEPLEIVDGDLGPRVRCNNTASCARGPGGVRPGERGV